MKEVKFGKGEQVDTLFRKERKSKKIRLSAADPQTRSSAIKLTPVARELVKKGKKVFLFDRLEEQLMILLVTFLALCRSLICFPSRSLFRFTSLLLLSFG